MRRESHVRFWESARVRVPRATRHNEHRHSGISLLTPAMLHHGSAAHVLAARHDVMLAAYSSHPDRFIAGKPRRQEVPQAAWINQPADIGTAA